MPGPTLTLRFAPHDGLPRYHAVLSPADSSGLGLLQGVVYRDCKPGNFLFTETSPSNRRVKATDLGLATR